MNRNIRRLGLVFVGLFIMLVAQLNYLQVIRADHLANHPGNTRNAIRDFGQPRGRIITADGVVIAESYRNPDKSSPYTYLRRYPRGPLYAHITGYFSFNYGSAGIERSYNSVLAGRKVPSTAKGLKAALSSKTITADVTLTINHELQLAAEKALRKRKGSIVVLDTKTGAVLASVSYPSYDPNPLTSPDFEAVKNAWVALQADERKPMLARAYRETYPPGSTFKVITATTGIETGVAGTESPTYPTVRAIKLPDSTRSLRNFGGGSCGGTLVTVFKLSCNTSFARLGLDVGAEQMNDGARLFGFNRSVPLDVSPSAAKSFFPAAGYFDANRAQLAFAAIGQGQVNATVLQMAMVASAVANLGRIKDPHFMREVRNSENEILEKETTNTFARAMSEKTAKTLNFMMQQVVNKGGTGTRAAIKGYTIAAKTGTAQTNKTADQQSGRTAHAWTIAFAPADAPRLAIAVIIEDQNEVSSTTGGKIAAPVVRTVLRQALSIQGITQESGGNTSDPNDPQNESDQSDATDAEQ